MHRLDRSLLDTLEEIIVRLINQMVGIKTNSHALNAFYQSHHFTTVLSQTSAGKIFYTKFRPNFLGNGSQFCNGRAAEL